MLSLITSTLNDMKNKLALMIGLAGSMMFAACSNNSEQTNSTSADTAEQQTPYRDTTKIDTSAPTTVTGDASQLDNSGNGGTKVAKDSTNKQ
jgi:uncharacterized lipoprotein YajG